MRLEEELRYGATPESVAALLAEPSFHEEVCRRTGSTNFSVSVDGSPETGDFTVSVNREASTAQLPDFARKFVGETIKVTQREFWTRAGADGSRTAEVDITLSGVPLKISASESLRPDSDGTIHAYAGELTSSMPFMGAKIESAAERVLRKALKEQESLVRERLAL
ncbi:DUF2505 domain-containing protein [Saxibacter everestensis]|uniref:DUF2505 domain-containing protein n=1 Tax=Saxibacter everestensis TaxID=2909229 RepID=A0ABY8QQP2_9MICO|nr:DUF2505 domain-containing protein [Brevibacteriaceae bacterium ZFBP1038]